MANTTMGARGYSCAVSRVNHVSIVTHVTCAGSPWLLEQSIYMREKLLVSTVGQQPS